MSPTNIKNNNKKDDKLITNFFNRKRGRKYASCKRKKFRSIIRKAEPRKKQDESDFKPSSESDFKPSSSGSESDSSLSYSPPPVKKMKPPAKKMKKLTVIANKETKVYELSSDDSIFDISSSEEISEKTTTVEKKMRGIRTSWSDPEHFPFFVESINHWRRGNKKPLVSSTGTFVPLSTMREAIKRLGGKEPTRANCFPIQKRALLTPELIELLQDIIRRRDRSNNGMTRREVIAIISDLGQSKSFKTSENHLDYLIRSNRLTKLKRNGRIVSAQSTSTDRCQINIPQQMRWHYLIQGEWEHLKQSNQPSFKFEQVMASFQLNLDEACFMCSSGTLKIIGDGQKKRHDKNLADNRFSITCVRIGSSAGENGPVIFLTEGQGDNSVNRNFTKERLTSVYGLPEGSRVLCNSSGYMDDITWIEVVKEVAAGIRKMPVICDHPDWWVCLSMDGFKSHVNVLETMEVWTQYKIRVAKEEAATSHINQAYDKFQAKQDKQVTRELLEMCRNSVTTHVNNWQLIGILSVGIKNLPADIWKKSFIAVNMHPDHRISFQEWINKISSHIDTGEASYSRTNMSIFDAMPEFWKNMTVRDRQNIIKKINEFKAIEKGSLHQVFTKKAYIIHLTRYVLLNNIQKLRICYNVSVNNPDVVQGNRNIPAPDPSASVATPAQPLLTSFMLLPPDLVQKCKIPNSFQRQAKEDLFNHIIRFRNRCNFENRQNTIAPYINVEVTKTQQDLLNPTALDCITGFIMKDSHGKFVHKRLPQRRLNLIDSTISSQCTILNSEERMKLIKKANEVAAVIADIEIDRAKKREENKKKKEADDRAKQLKKIEAKARQVRATIEATRSCAAIINEIKQKGNAHIQTLKVDALKTLTRYQFKSDKYKEKGIKKVDLVAFVTQEIEAQKLSDTSNDAPPQEEAVPIQLGAAAADEEVAEDEPATDEKREIDYHFHNESDCDDGFEEENEV